MTLIYDIQLAKQDKKVISALFIDVKGAFDHVSANQLIKICIDLCLPKLLCSWIDSFLVDRKIQLAFDNGKSIKTDIQIGIPQGSPISPILFLIYIRNLFQDLESRGMSYINNIGLVALSESIEKNCKILKEAVIRIFEKGADNLIQFDLEKTELIYFHSKRNIGENVNICFLENYLVEAKPTVKWLGIWLDSKLKFKEYVEKKVAQATRIFHQIKRLFNIERGLLFQVIRQLYIACIILIADYGVLIWWNNQKHLLEKFERFQNVVLQTMLGAFKISPTKAMEIEAVVSLSRVRFEKTCYNYAIRIMQMNSMHPIIERVPEDFPPFIGKAEFDSAKFLKWNDLIHPETDNENERVQISDSESDFSNDEIHRRKKR